MPDPNKSSPDHSGGQLFGRAAELRELEDRLALVQLDGKVRSLTVLGSAGIGKTRLVRDFLRRAQQSRSSRVYRGGTREGDATFGVFSRLLRSRFGLVEGMAPEAQNEIVRAEVAKVLGDRKVGDVCYFLGQLMGLEFFDSPLIRALAADASQAAHLRRAVMRRFFEADAASNSAPMVLLFDDLHHASADSLELLRYLMRETQAPIFFICVGRPEVVTRCDDWGIKNEFHGTLELGPLSEADAATVMQDLLAPCGDEPAVEDLIDAACTLAGGNPALLEQMVSVFFEMNVLESEDPLAEHDRWIIHDERLEGVRLPLTVQDAVEARIASLTPDERTLLEYAAMMGGVFWEGGLVALRRSEKSGPVVWNAGADPAQVAVKQMLAQLTSRDYILHLPDSTFPGDDEFVFKHNLERETLSKQVPSAIQRRCHACLADWLSFKANVRDNEEQLTLLAKHYELAGFLARSAAAYMEAAAVARSHYANAKAADLYAKGLSLYNASGSSARIEELMIAYHHYGDVLNLLGRIDEAEATFRNMLELAYRLDLKAKGGAAHGRIGRLYRDMGRLEEATPHLEAALGLFEAARDERGLASTIDDIGKLYWLRGNYERALEATQRSLAMRRRLGDRRSIALSLNNLGLVYQDSGQYAEARQAFEQSLQIRREIGDLVGVCVTLNNLGTVAQDQGDDARALSLFNEALAVAKESNDKARLGLVIVNLGETYTRLGQPDLAITCFEQGREVAEELGDKLGVAEAIRGLGKAHLGRQDLTKAREWTGRAVDLLRELDSKVQLGIALRVLGEVVAAGSAGGPSAHQAREHLHESIRIFEGIGNQVELSRSYRAYADLLSTSSEFVGNPDAQSEARRYAELALAHEARLKA